MRLFITTYQKTGTHQLYPMFVGDEDFRRVDDIADKAGYSMVGIPPKFHVDGLEKGNAAPIPEALKEVCKELASFQGRNFGHIGYSPEYAEAMQRQPTKVLFGIRDPRDVIVAEYESILKKVAELGPGYGFLNWIIYEEDGKESWLIDRPDPIADLIELASYRWPNWLGWLDQDYVMPVRYEDLRPPETEGQTIDRIIAWIAPHKAPDKRAMLKRKQPGPQNPTFRKGAIGEWRERFNEKHRAMSESLLADVIERLGYAKA